jgi:erythromycin esterase-like protein
LYETGVGNSLLILDETRQASGAEDVRGHRAIGVVYHPTREAGNYVPSVLPDRYDAFLYFDESQALHPLHIQPEMNEPPETYPWGV